MKNTLKLKALFLTYHSNYSWLIYLQDSLLAAPIILDLVILCEICERIKFKVGDDHEFQSFHPVLSLLSYLLKAPLVPDGTPVVNALFKQRSCIENVFRWVDCNTAAWENQESCLSACMQMSPWKWMSTVRLVNGMSTLSFIKITSSER